MNIIIILFITILLFSNSIENTNDTYQYPTEYTSISSNYGYRELYGASNFHNGIDFLAPQCSEVYASNSGYVSYASFLEDGFGNTVILTHNNNIKTMYCHLDENFVVSVGQNVSKGDVIGNVGPRYLSNGIMNGNTTGPHLHFTVYKNNTIINPLELLN